MPGILLAFWIVIGFGGLSALKGPPFIFAPPDSIARSHLGKPGRFEYDLAVSVPWVAVAKRDIRGVEFCTVTLFPRVTQGRVVRLIFDGEEQLLDSSWSLIRRLEPGERKRFEAVFLDPADGAELARRWTEVECLSDLGAAVRDQVLYDERGLRGYEPPPCRYQP